MGENINTEKKARNPYKQILLLGLVILCGAGYFLFKNIFIALTYKRTTASVLSVKEFRSSGSKSSSTYTPTVKYRTESGQSVSAQTLISSSMYNFNRGDKVIVYYNPAQAHDFYISTFFTMWFIQAGGFIFGLLIVKAALPFKNEQEINQAV